MDKSQKPLILDMGEHLLQVVGKHLILSHPSAIHVYAVSTSSLIRTLPLKSKSKEGTITGYALAHSSPEHLYACTSEGIIFEWDWVNGKRLGRWTLSSRVDGLAVGCHRTSNQLVDIVYTREQKANKWRISAHKLRGGNEASKTESKTIYQSDKQITSFKCVLDGRVIVATSEQHLLVGLSETPTTTLRDTKYVWREIRAPDWIACLDVQHANQDHGASAGKKKSKQTGASVPNLDVVIGDVKGAIFVYEDLLNRLIDREKGTSNYAPSLLTPRRLHWHRELVSSISWSLDGNYVISGGSETVLVLWQLDTNKRQYLPHLSASIDNMAVSPSGSLYALGLSDNSAMVLSTAELKPVANFAGIQTPRLQYQMKSSSGQVLTVNSQASRVFLSTRCLPSPPLSVSSTAPQQLLIAVPSSQAPSSVSPPTPGLPCLQTFDFGTNRHVSRQALARTNTTNLNSGPDTLKIDEPVVKFVQCSNNGTWLASVDEWEPPIRDLEHVSLRGTELDYGQHRQREVFLKFWQWNPDSKEWALVTRVDGPHATDTGIAANHNILDVQADPAELGFATIGEDGTVRIWRTKARLRDNLSIRGKDGNPLASWTCRHTVKLDPVRVEAESNITSQERHYTATTASIAFSADGTVLAASHVDPLGGATGVVHFIDPSTGMTRCSRTGLYSGRLEAMGFIHQYLVLLSEAMIVWDMVHELVHYALSLKPTGLSSMTGAAATRLAIDQANGTFAVALPVVDQGGRDSVKHKDSMETLLRRAHSQVVVFSHTSPVPIYSIALPHLVLAMVHAKGSKGFVTLDVEAEIRTISPQSGFKPLSATESSEPLNDSAYAVGVPPKLDSIPSESNYAQVEDFRDADDGGRGFAAIDEEGDAPVVRAEQLTDIFDTGPAYAMPPVEDLFEQVAGLFARKATVAG